MPALGDVIIIHPWEAGSELSFMGNHLFCILRRQVFATFAFLIQNCVFGMIPSSHNDRHSRVHLCSLHLPLLTPRSGFQLPPWWQGAGGESWLLHVQTVQLPYREQVLFCSLHWEFTSCGQIPVKHAKLHTTAYIWLLYIKAQGHVSLSYSDSLVPQKSSQAERIESVYNQDQPLVGASFILCTNPSQALCTTFPEGECSWSLCAYSLPAYSLLTLLVAFFILTLLT